MKRLNIIYVAGFLLFILMGYVALHLQSKSVFFYGFAENKSTEVNHSNNVLIKKIYVNDGQKVKKGDILLDVINNEVNLKINEVDIDKQVLTVAEKLKRSSIENKIIDIQGEKAASIAKLRNEIKLLKKQKQINEELYKGLNNIDKDEIQESKLSITIDQLQNRIAIIEKTKDSEIDYQKGLLRDLRKPNQLKSQNLDNKLEYLSDMKGKLSIYAPSDGLIGSISCEEGENISAFTKLLDFYNHNPTQVKGYVHESQILEVDINDTLEVASTLHPEIKVLGTVMGLGSRIVEIPERLRKIPDFKVYGREVLIRIPSDNKFLQKEKVMLNVSRNMSNRRIGGVHLARERSRSHQQVSELK